MATLLMGCDSAEEQAQKHLEKAIELAEAGDVARARVELRNAVSKDESLIEAHLMLAQLFIEEDATPAAFAAYRRVFEMRPDHLEAARNLAQIALDAQAFEDAEKYAAAAVKLAPEDPEIAAVKAVLAHRLAVVEKDDVAIGRAIRQARDLLVVEPELLRARRMLTGAAIDVGNIAEARKLLEKGLELHPKDRVLHNQQLLLLTRLQDDVRIEVHLLKMIDLWPEDEALEKVIIQFYLHAGRLDDAETWVRSRIEPKGDAAEPRLSYLRFLSELRSTEAMRDALVEMLTQSPLPNDIASNLPLFRAMQARVNFSLGERTQAISDMEVLIAELEAEGEVNGELAEQSNHFKIQLAQMHLQSGNPVGSRALVEEVLERDQGQTDALKMKSAWQIEEDNTDAAIVNLRSALSNAPNDSQALTLLAQAYQREGRTGLMADMLARAVEASNQGVQESLRYARYLISRQELPSAETVLIDALRRQSNSADVLFLLGRVHLSMESWGRLHQDIDALRKRFVDDEDIQRRTDELQAEMLQHQGRDADLNAFLLGLIDQSADDFGARVAMIQNTIRQGDIAQAYEDALALEQDAPRQPLISVILAQLETVMGTSGQARNRLQELVEKIPAFEQGWTSLYSLDVQEGRDVQAGEVLTDALEALPESRVLNLIQAQRDERDGDLEEAIAIYEELYARDSSDVIVANNLASLLSAARNDEETLERAWRVARRLNGAQHPALRDTYGWLALLRGEAEVALRELKAAAEGLPEDPSVAYHLGRAYAANGQIEEAAVEYARARELITEGATTYPGLVDQIKTYQAQLAN